MPTTAPPRSHGWLEQRLASCPASVCTVHTTVHRAAAASCRRHFSPPLWRSRRASCSCGAFAQHLLQQRQQAASQRACHYGGGNSPLADLLSSSGAESCRSGSEGGRASLRSPGRSSRSHASTYSSRRSSYHGGASRPGSISGLAGGLDDPSSARPAAFSGPGSGPLMSIAPQLAFNPPPRPSTGIQLRGRRFSDPGCPPPVAARPAGPACLSLAGGSGRRMSCAPPPSLCATTSCPPSPACHTDLATQHPLATVPPRLRASRSRRMGSLTGSGALDVLFEEHAQPGEQPDTGCR